MYNNVYELPNQVLNSLNMKDAQYWMDQYNRCDPKSQDEVLKAMKNAWHACATRPSSFSFRIVGSTDEVDDYGTIIDLDRTKEILDETIRHGGNIQNDHHNYQIGALWDWKPCKVEKDDGTEVDGVMIYGNLYGGGYVYDKARKSFVDGMNNLSLAGEAPEKSYECDERGCYVRRKLKQLMEISLTRSPGNKDCILQWYNKDAAIARSTSVGIPIKEYTIHRDTSTCPVMSLQRSLERIGYECTAHHDGVHILMDFEEFARDESVFRSHGLDIDYMAGGYAKVSRPKNPDIYSLMGPKASAQFNTIKNMVNGFNDDQMNKLYRTFTFCLENEIDPKEVDDFVDYGLSRMQERASYLKSPEKKSYDEMAKKEQNSGFPKDTEMRTVEKKE